MATGLETYVPGMAAFAGLMFLFVIIAIGLYIYWAFAWMNLAKKLGYKNAWLAWIPLAQLALWPILAKKHWAWVFILLVPIVNIVFMIIWHWKIFEFRNYPGWLSLIIIVEMIPVINWIGWIGYYIIIGIVSWADR